MSITIEYICLLNTCSVKRSISFALKREFSCNRSLGGPISGLVGRRGGCYHQRDVVQSRGGTDKRVWGWFEGWHQCAGRSGTGRPWIMLGAMMYPGAEDELADMRVPPIQLEHLPEVFLCTYIMCCVCAFQWFRYHGLGVVSFEFIVTKHMDAQIERTFCLEFYEVHSILSNNICICIFLYKVFSRYLPNLFYTNDQLGVAKAE